MKSGKEFAAGGIVERNGKLLLVEVENLKGEIVWTFPKGHLEEGESVKAGALREVEEETGWRCEIIDKLTDVTYWFNRNGRPIFKRVRWFTMKPVKKTGTPDAVEIRKTRWVEKAGAGKFLRYPSDLDLLKKLSTKLSRDKPGDKSYRPAVRRAAGR